VSRLRARCPSCYTLTAVALGPDYECHACGGVYGAGLVRVPRAWGTGGEALALAARMALPYPDVAVIEEGTLVEQNLALAASLPERPLVLGGCCCAHVGAIEGLAARGGRLGVVWLDAHGDLNTPETSPSGNEWGMALRMVIDGGTVRADDVALVGARNLDPGELAFIEAVSLPRELDGVERALADVDAVYVALDCDVLDPQGVDVWFPEADGLAIAEAETVLRRAAQLAPLAGAGLTGLVPSDRNELVLRRLCGSLGLEQLTE
jgi:arginase family enzyme